MLSTLNKQRSIRLLTLLILLCILSVNFEISFVVKKELTSVPLDDLIRNRFTFLKSNQFMMQESSESAITQTARTLLSGLKITSGEIRSLKSANDAVEKGRKLWQEIESAEKNRVMGADNLPDYNNLERCPYSVSISKDELTRKGNVTVLPCGLTLGSHITVIGKPRRAHVELGPNQEKHMVSQFTLELHGLKTVSEGENPPRILHVNPRLKGDWSGTPIIEHNTCYRMQWGTPQRCHGWSSTADKDTVDGFAKCEKWIIDDDGDGESKATIWWLKRLIRRGENLDLDWPFPFVEDKTFVFNLSAGFEGYHMSVDGRHVSSFPYGPAFTPEDATGLYVNGDVDVLSIFAASLPTSHTSFGPQKHLDLSDKWKAPPVPDGPVELLIGILSAGNHFAERMAVRKSWMQHELIKSSNVVARFFVALHERKGVNEEVKKEAEFFGDIVIVPYMDNYDLLVIKTVAICEYGVQSVSAKYIMKGDDDTFVRVDAIMNEVMKKNVESDGGLYVGKMNYYHVPLRTGKWAVTHEEWAKGVYPPYADGAAYIISSDIANSILSDFQKAQLRLFKMEDVSMGIWVEKFNKTRRVEFVHSMKFCQFGCVENYITAHYQSPRQMICLWNKLRRHGRPSCCNMR